MFAAAACLAQFIGHEIEGRKPSFLGDRQFLLVGQLFLIVKVFPRPGYVTEPIIAAFPNRTPRCSPD